MCSHWHRVEEMLHKTFANHFVVKEISREMIWGGWWEGCSGLGIHVHPWRIHVNVWQNQYSIVK